ncbi:S-adenosylmethionine:tRNA ribosyltransferase-isomerase [Parabacteroides sp. PF5-5]|uniref:S-adenosylmethionine:tRNA ribosyltransferase-isomerase n=1 Tax=unclassified Parabacteroides TaxID=2649774 RepID=UPI0024748761|nr:MULTISPECIES: S-adenosylmethionine:tRNA ribosyltransferase-isomerase [unclassified Parabacteroides]MDH6305254.1 S-adenosylmethionine:tRNA ribosyltransferase-isomerase [Parabacteroides sp. PH5-39]MDH6316607.1 S-adenosylmethionine:tRNA ribosyltransferase-isomerase [Parabacteroides sp. PF5-13]MDH6320213.1 S-adenosylmethionine:tRNA ribosyltransferase-isomerase [Parabacteroides sp. PH5-13]MDH6323844.1 S-adenosylmethionine:tRNA ribosyltransferase-isomerase [Parabacteroides sp. PH5-8]MDH6327890.1 
MIAKTQQIRMEEYDYPLPDERIAKFPLPQRDESKLLLYRNGEVSESIFRNISEYLPKDSLLVFNNTRVIQARLLFRKETGASIEIFCLEPVEPHDYALVFQQKERCTWLCMVGNLKKWKEGTLCRSIQLNDTTVRLKAEKKQSFGETHLIEFSWDHPDILFADLLDAVGILPIPPYLHRETEASDLQTYQTVYSKIKGSVAAPTAGLHFTPEVLAELDARGFSREELTLHVGAGTFKPVKSETIEGHEMHTEFISVNRSTIEHIQKKASSIIAVGTTSVRTLESLYYIGVMLSANPEATTEELVVNQWMPYEESNNRLPVEEALQNVLMYLDKHKLDKLITATQIMIAPGYEFKIVKGIITNFHQPNSTLLLLVSAFVKGKWKLIYDYALSHEFRFLSYGDSSLLLSSDN